MPKLTENIKPTGFKLLQYGESGSGKSVRAAMFAQFGPVYFFDFDNKIGNIQAYMRAKFPQLAERIEYDVYRGGDADVVIRVSEKLKAVEANVAKYATLVIDSWTQFERTYLDHLMSKYMGIGGKGWGAARTTIQITKDEKIIIPGTEDHQLKNRAFPEFIDRLTALPLNIIVNCHVKEVMKGPATIAASGEVAKTLPKYFNEFHYLYVASGNAFRVRVRGNDDFLANTSRTDVGPSGVLDKDDLTVYSNQLVTLA
jgi:hypothetical protein